MRVLVVTGSSGGHIFPALSFLEALKAKDSDAELLLVLPRKNITGAAGNYGYNVRYISISTIKKEVSFRNLCAMLGLFKGCLESIFILRKFSPELVVGFGSLASVPMDIFPRLFRVKTLIHEQNVLPGRSNKLLARFTDKIAVSFDKTLDYLKDFNKKAVITGNPIRRDLKACGKTEALRHFGFTDNKFTVLVMGGSQGSRNINSAFLQAVLAMPDKQRLQIIHLSGSSDYDFLKNAYENTGVEVKIFSFLKEMHYAYSASDIAVSRSGAATITELMFFKLPAILIPYPFAYRHQLDNASVLVDKGCAVLVDDKKLCADILKLAMEGIMRDPERLKAIRSGYDGLFFPDAASLLAQEAMSL